MDKNNEVLEAFINWFMREYSNFGGKPISERYDEAFDTFNNDFIDARYDAFQDGWKAQQAKVDGLQEEFAEDERFLKEQIQNKELEISNLKYLQGMDKELIQSLQNRVDLLQKRVDAALVLIESKFEEFCDSHCMNDIMFLEEVEQALKGEVND
ncbi:hypothetical protein ACS125_18625 [Acinetobacter sp. PFS20]|uniref:hypothetical protein n=1 Tax=Acinetobacter sp. PFS20 TaxID=3458434 RepID=UPI003FD4B34D